MSTGMATGGRSGVSPVTLVVFIILVLIAGTIAFVMYTRQVVVKEKLGERDHPKAGTVRAQVREMDQDIKDLVAEQMDLAKYLTDKPDAEAVRQYFADLDMRGVDVTPRDFHMLNIDLDMWIARLDRLIRELDRRSAEASKQADSAEAARTRTKEHYTEIENQKNTELNTLDTFLRDEYAAKENLIASYVKEKQDFINKYNNARDKWETEKQGLLVLTDRTARQNAVIRRELTVLRPEPSIRPPSGKVLISDWQTKKVVINIGEEDHVFPGLGFEVYFFDAMGTRVLKGKVEVQTVRSQTSLATIIESDPRYPIVAGDAIQTVFLPVPRKQKFVIAGFIPPESVYDRSQLEALIRLNGGEVDPAVGLYTDVLILGETAPTGLAEMDKDLIGDIQKATQKARSEAELARELSVDVVDYREFIESMRR